jgi:hypothetical protein
MLIELKTNNRMDTESIVYLEYVDGWRIKMTNGSTVDLDDYEYPWLMTICGDLLEVNSKLSINILTIVLIQPNEQGFLIFWNGEPPIQITVDEGEKLNNYIKEKKQHVILFERINFLIEKNININYKKLV